MAPPFFQNKKRIALLLGMGTCLVFAYVGSYAWLTLHGQYEPYAWGLQGPVDSKGCYFQPKGYSWVPNQFTTPDGEFNALPDFYLPLYWADLKWWHNHHWPEPGEPAVDVDVARDSMFRYMRRHRH